MDALGNDERAETAEPASLQRRLSHTESSRCLRGESAKRCSPHREVQGDTQIGARDQRGCRDSGLLATGGALARRRQRPIESMFPDRVNTEGKERGQKGMIGKGERRI